jgi:hypothetical protein
MCLDHVWRSDACGVATDTKLDLGRLLRTKDMNWELQCNVADTRKVLTGNALSK